LSSDKKIVLITGASSVFGKVTANLLQEKGFRVFGTSRKPTPENFEMLLLDVNSDDSVKSCVTSLLERTGGKIDVLMNNAGFQMGGIEEVSSEEAKLQLETNLWGYVRMAKGVLPVMRQQKSGRIINIGSLGGIVPVPFMGYYSISKFALEAFAEALRQEVRSLGIWVYIVEPAFFKTDI
jgi:NADP-dependent 3-hydroxy acid dehydrogenase YdfG